MARRDVWLRSLYIQAASLSQELEEYNDDLDEALKVGKWDGTTMA
jgi:hypothetical protein